MPTNLERAEWAAAALRHFQSTTGTDDGDALPDLLCDLLHWSDREKVNFQNALDTARMHYQAECEEQNANDQQATLPPTVQNLIAALEPQVEITRRIIEAFDTDCLPETIEDLINTLGRRTESARTVLDAWQNSKLLAALRDVGDSLTAALKAIANAKGGAP